MKIECPVNVGDNHVSIEKTTLDDLLVQGSDAQIDDIEGIFSRVVRNGGYGQVIFDGGVYKRMDRLPEVEGLFADEKTRRVARRLTRLHLDLEGKGNKGDDWRLARHLEDAIGSGQYNAGDVEKARTLLEKHGF